MTLCPVTCWTMAESIYVALLLYMNWVPGGLGIGQPRKAFTQFSCSTVGNVGTFPLPTDVVSRSLTRKAARCSLTCSGRSCGKNEITRSSTRSLPSVTAKPTAVEVKLLLSEYSV